MKILSSRRRGRGRLTLAVVAIGAVFLGQSVSVWQGLGIALVIAGVVLLHVGGTNRA